MASSASAPKAPSVPWCIETIAARPRADGGGASAMWALATSKLTGRIWDGHIVLVAEPAQLQDGAASVRVGEGRASSSSSSSASSAAAAGDGTATLAVLNTESGITDLVWLNPDLIAATTDRGQLQIVRVPGWARRGVAADEGGAPTLLFDSTYMEHDDTAVAVAQSPVDPTRVATAGWDGMVNMWTLDAAVTSQPKTPVVRQHKGHGKDVVNDVDWHATDANLFASVGSDSHVFVWDCRQKRPAATIKLEADGMSLVWSRTSDVQLFVGDQAGCVQTLDTRTMAAAAAPIDPKASNPRGVRRLLQLADRPDHLAFVSDDLQLRLASLTTLAVVAQWKDHTDFPRGLAQSPLGLVTAGWDAQVHWRALPVLE